MQRKNKVEHAIIIEASSNTIDDVSSIFKEFLPTSAAYFLALTGDSQQSTIIARILQDGSGLKPKPITHGLRIEASHVYVFDIDTPAAIVNGEVHLLETKNTTSTTFITSLANYFAGRTLAVDLDGTGKYLSEGIRAIKEAGGQIFLKKHDNNVSGLIEGGDSVKQAYRYLPVERIPQAIRKYIKEAEATDSLYIDSVGSHEEET